MNLRAFRPTLLFIVLLAGACVRPAPHVQVTPPPPGAAPASSTPFQPQAALTQAAPTQPAANIEPATPALQPTPTQPPAAAPITPPEAAPAPTQPQPTAAPPIVWIDPHLPEALRQGISLPEGVTLTTDAALAGLRLAPGGENPVSRWVYALVAPFPTVEIGVTADELRQAWQGALLAGRGLLVDASTAHTLSALWGPPGQSSVTILPTADLLGAAWQQRSIWAIIPFEAVEPRWKVIQVNGQSPLQRDFDPGSYALSLPISFSGDPALAAQVSLPATNRDPARLTTLAMTGVTALVRATAFSMEQQGINYPGRDIAAWLQNADLTHISNEVPFAQNCPYPDPVQQSMRFCSDPRYIELLETVGTDIVELTGDHFQDWGVQAMLLTLDMYRARGWQYYGGGANLEEGRRALLVEHNGNRLAFIGCNAKGAAFAQAGPDRPGAVPCDMDWMASETARLRAEGYLPIATFQHFEYYTYRAQPNQVADARRLIEAGAVIVSGSQAHQPQAFELIGPTFIHYGLGNLFFDQYDISAACRQMFVDRHVFYNGRYLGVELLPAVFVDYARPRPMDWAERTELMNAVFAASGW